MAERNELMIISAIFSGRRVQEKRSEPQKKCPVCGNGNCLTCLLKYQKIVSFIMIALFIIIKANSKKV
jgi:hypothetical protein